MPVYPCPECGAQLRSANPVLPGKKLRCPKCEAVFAPVAELPAKKKVAKPAAPVPPAPADEEEGGQYGLAQEVVDKGAEETQRAAFDPIKNRFKLSARGPALILVVRPSDWLLRTGALICLFAVTGALWSVWPMIFKIEIVQKDDKESKWRPPAKDDGRRFEELTPEQFKERWLFFGGFVFQFLWGAIVCNGASKMHTLESYTWAMVGSIMAMIGPGVPAAVYIFMDPTNEPYTMFIGVLLAAVPGVPMAMWCIATLRNKKVIAGFTEEKPEDS